MRSFAWLVACFALPAVCPGHARADVIVSSTFEVDGEDWFAREVGGNDNTLTYFTTGGNPGGYLNARDIRDSRVWYWWAPAKFNGDFSAAYGGTLTFDLREHGTGGQFDANLGDVRLKGADIVLAFDTPNNPTVGTTWTSYNVSLAETASGWHLNNLNGAVPTQAQFQTVLASLDILVIRGEYVSGADTGDLDNVALNSPSTAVPEPGSLTLTFLGAGLLGFLGWYRRG